MAWTIAYRDTEKTIERQATGGVDADGNPVFEERIIYANANRQALTERAIAAFNTNRTAIAATNPTNAQVVAQVKNLSAQNNAIMRLLLGMLDGMLDGTD
jgi:hypothetical protein